MKQQPPRIGRPPLDDDADSVPVHVKMTPKDYDTTFRRAQRDGVTVPEQIRRDVRNAALRNLK